MTINCQKKIIYSSKLDWKYYTKNNTIIKYLIILIVIRYHLKYIAIIFLPILCTYLLLTKKNNIPFQKFKYLLRNNIIFKKTC